MQKDTEKTDEKAEVVEGAQTFAFSQFHDPAGGDTDPASKETVLVRVEVGEPLPEVLMYKGVYYLSTVSDAEAEDGGEAEYERTSVQEVQDKFDAKEFRIVQARYI